MTVKEEKRQIARRVTLELADLFGVDVTSVAFWEDLPLGAVATAFKNGQASRVEKIEQSIQSGRIRDAVKLGDRNGHVFVGKAYVVNVENVDDADVVEAP